MVRLGSLADLAAFRDRWSSAPLPPPQPRAERTQRPAPDASHEADTLDAQSHTRVGYLAFVLGPTSGFVVETGSGILVVSNQRTAAWAFPDPSKLHRALHLALGLNRRLFELRVVPALCPVQGARS